MLSELCDLVESGQLPCIGIDKNGNILHAFHTNIGVKKTNVGYDAFNEDEPFT